MSLSSLGSVAITFSQSFRHVDSSSVSMPFVAERSDIAISFREIPKPVAKQPKLIADAVFGAKVGYCKASSFPKVPVAMRAARRKVRGAERGYVAPARGRRHTHDRLHGYCSAFVCFDPHLIHQNQVSFRLATVVSLHDSLETNVMRRLPRSLGS